MQVPFLHFNVNPVASMNDPLYWNPNALQSAAVLQEVVCNL